ncbi:S-adenosyl-L-methionine-dependent methyltransferase [Marasmius fiardii PR-910]|nr:S-adenosyl-L-methionine-dependent methyltransferase [Marasmius fiardii PR-910]
MVSGQVSTTDAPDNSGWSASLYNKNASFVYSTAFTTPVLQLLDARPGEKIVDFGCGSAEVTLEIEKMVVAKSAPGGLVVGVDNSDSMIKKSKENGLKNCFVADVQQPLELPQALSVPRNGYDAVFTNATLHWCKRDPGGVIQSVKSLLRPGGRFVGEMGGFMNCVGVRSVLHLVMKRRGYDPTTLDPWFFPSTEQYSKLLVQHGFEVKHISLNPRLTPLPAGMKGWLDVFVCNSWLHGVSEEEANDIMNEVEDICRIDCQDGEGNWSMMYVRLRFVGVLTSW